MMLAIARREWRAGILSPLLWGLLTVNQVILAWVFLRVVERFAGLEAAQREAGLTLEISLNLFSFAAALSLLAAPVLATRMIGSELRDGTFNLLGAAPVSLASILAGKFLALAGLVTLVSLPALLMGALLAGVARVDAGLLGAAALGLWLSGWLFAAVGLFGASLTTQPGMAAAASYGILILLSVIGRTGPEGAGGLFDWLSWNEHLFWFLLGVVRTGDLAYFALLIGFFLALSHRRLANRRLD